MTKTELLQKIEKSVPAAKGNLTIDRVYFDREKNWAVISFLSERLIGQEQFQAIKRVLEGIFADMRISVRIASPALAEPFMQEPGQYAEPILDFLCRQYPCAIGWRRLIRFTTEGGRLKMEVPSAFAADYFVNGGAREKVRQAVSDIFRIDLPVSIEVRGDAQALLEEELKAREAELKLLQSSLPAAPLKKPAEEKKSDRIRGRAIADPPVAIEELNQESGRVTIRGRVLSVETREVSGGATLLLTFGVTDLTSSIKCKTFLNYRPRGPRGAQPEEEAPITSEEKAAVEAIVKEIKVGQGILVRGKTQYDNFLKEVIIMADDISHAELPQRMDNAEEKRVELHLHTNMSTMDAISSVSALMERAAKWGHKAIAVTDHGVVQAYPEAFGAAKKYGIKLIPGVEAYLTDDEAIVEDATDTPLDEPIVVLDFETTGLNTRKDRMIEFGAVKLAHGQIVDSIDLFINPGFPLPQKITELTHITDQMLYGQDDAATALPKIMKFIGDCPVAAHNAKFDISILRNELKRVGQTFERATLDTLSMARKLYPELKSHKLGAVCKRLNVSLKDAHRAVNDATATAQCLGRMLDEAKKRGCATLADLNDLSHAYTLGSSTHIVLLAKDQKGVENINHIVTEAHLNYFRRRPMVPRAVLQRYREGLIVGSACIEGELMQAVAAGESDDRLKKIARFYDYLEIQPIGNNAFMLREGLAEDEEALRDMNRKVVWLGEQLGIPVCATGDVHFLDPEDAIFRTIIQNAQGFKDCEQQPPLYLKTTDEMLEEFSYLGKEKAFEVVVTNTNRIADRVEKTFWHIPHPEGKETFSPFWEDAAHDIETMSWQTAHEMYGDELPEIITKRLEKELSSIIGYGYATLYSIANKLVQKSLRDGYLVGSRGSVGSSFVACMSGITEVNALPPHYRCAKCRKGYFDIPKGYTVGVDLPDKKCPVCGEPLRKEGFDIPFEVFLGFKGDKVPDIDLNFSGEYQPRAHAYIEEVFGKGSVFRAGTIGTLAEKTAYGYVLKYLEEHEKTVSDAEKDRLAAGCVGVKRTTGQHPGGIVVLPKNYDICQFTAVQHPAVDLECGIVTTHFDFNSMHDVLVKLDCLGHDDPTMMHMLEELTGVSFKSIPLDDKRVMSLFSSPEALGVTQEQIDCTTGTLGVPEFGTSFVRGMLDETHPTTMEELIRISGLSHGTDVWLGNARDLIMNGTAHLKDCICTRDDIMNALIAYGVESKMSFTTMESVRKGKGLKPEMEEAMVAHNVPPWFIDSCKKIKYMFPKGHAVAYVTMALRVAWYKVYYPQAYYSAYFTIRGDGFDAMTMLLPF
ncbi:MAG: PolC-type DNA polymerase III, partial [Clostridia bacterium]|nr:PolC-type DNA polymerase III [Clostridia bacterium]